MSLDFENSNLLLEDELGALDRLSLIDLQTQLSFSRTYIDILILCSRDGSQLAQFFYSLGIPHIVYFEFKPHENDLFLKHLQDICMNEFSIQFYEEIFNNKSILESFNHAKEVMISNIFRKYRNFIQEWKMFEKILGVGPKLLPFPFVETIVPMQYKPGRLDDISSVKASTNIEKYDEIILGRKKELYDIIRTLNERQCVNIYGEKGIGKTKFARVVGYYMLRLGFKDGVFYFKLGNIRKKYNSDLQELMKTVFGEEFAKEIHCYFKNKEMLLIFDDYDEILKNDCDINLYMHIFCTLKDDNIPYILVTKNKVTSKKFIERIGLYHKLQPLDEAEVKEFLEFKFNELEACYQIEEKKRLNIKEDIKKIIEDSKGYAKPLLRQYKERIDYLKGGKVPNSPVYRSPFNNRNSKGKLQVKNPNYKSTPDMRTLSEKKKGNVEGFNNYFMVPIVEENEKDWKNKKFQPFLLEEEGRKIRSNSSANDEEQSKGKKNIKMNKTISYSPNILDNNKKIEISSSYITNSFEEFTSSEATSDDESSNKRVLKGGNSEDDEDSFEEIEENYGVLDDETEGSSVKLVKSLSNDQKKRDNSINTEKNDTSLRKIQSDDISFRNIKGKKSGKQGKKFHKNKKNKFKEGIINRLSYRKNRESSNDSEEEEEEKY